MRPPCVRCKETERLERGSYCRPCQTLNMRDWRARNPERNRDNGKRSDKKRYLNIAKYTEKRRMRANKWKLSNPEEYKRQCREKYHRIRDRVIKKLGDRCTCCGEHRKTMLHVDHINNDGFLERQGRLRSSYTMMKRILRDANAHDRYQTLCASCNHSKARNGGICEHKTERRINRFDRFKYRFDLANHIGVA